MNYIIRGDEGFANVGWYEVPSSSELSGVTPLLLNPDWTATASNPKRIYSAQGGYIETFSFGGVQSIQTKEFSPSTDTHMVSVLGDTKIGIVAYSFPSTDHYVQRVLWVACDSATDCINRIENGSWTSDNVLYNNLNASTSLPSFVVEDREWDETPSEDNSDPDNLLAQGGENADIMAFAETDLIGLTDLPNPDATMNMGYGGLITCYLLENTDMQSLNNALFDAGTWANLKNKFQGLSDPLSMILAAHQVPFSVTGTSGQFQIGNVVPEYNGNPVSCVRTATRYVKTTMGTVTLKEVFGSEKDYSNVSIQIYLPYVGVKDLDPDIVVGSACTLVCYADLWTGDILYMLHVSNATAAKKYFTAETVPYRWTGNCAKQVPLGRVDNSRMLINMASTIASVGVGMATFGVGAAGALGGNAGAAAAGAETGAAAANTSAMKTGAKQTVGAITDAASAGFQPIVQTSGGVNGAVGQMDLQFAYIMVKRGVPVYPLNWRQQIGAPQYQTYMLTNLSGFTQFAAIHLESMGIAVDEEVAELERLLKTEGIIL